MATMDIYLRGLPYRRESKDILSLVKDAKAIIPNIPSQGYIIVSTNKFSLLIVDWIKPGIPEFRNQETQEIITEETAIKLLSE